MRYADIGKALKGTGLFCRGGFRPGPDDGVPGVSGEANAGVVMIGNAGSGIWPPFEASRSQRRRKNEPHPMNEWTRDVMSPIAARLGAKVLFPFDGPPYYPFQRWALKADCVWPSPIGPLIHPHFGLWHAYRAALVFGPGTDLPARPSGANPCDDCADRPCLSTCMVGAFSVDGYDVPACTGHIAAPAGEECMRLSCQARRACPVGRDFIYQPDHARFHMSKFLQSHGS